MGTEHHVVVHHMCPCDKEMMSMAIASPFANPNSFQPKAQSLHAESNNAIHWQLSEGIIRHVGSRQEAHIRAVAFCNTSQGQMCSNMA